MMRAGWFQRRGLEGAFWSGELQDFVIWCLTSCAGVIKMGSITINSVTL